MSSGGVGSGTPRATSDHREVQKQPDGVRLADGLAEFQGLLAEPRGFLGSAGDLREAWPAGSVLPHRPRA